MIVERSVIQEFEIERLNTPRVPRHPDEPRKALKAAASIDFGPLRHRIPLRGHHKSGSLAAIVNIVRHGAGDGAHLSAWQIFIKLKRKNPTV